MFKVIIFFALIYFMKCTVNVPVFNKNDNLSFMIIAHAITVVKCKHKFVSKFFMH